MFLGGESVDGSLGTELNASLGEVRFIKSVNSDNWITTEYNNQSDVATFWTIAEVGGGGGAPATFIPRIMSN
jgi:hypothetical protein